MTYYYLNSAGQNVGPLDIETLRAHGITRETLVWAQGMPDWTKAGDVAELACLFQATPPPFGSAPNYGLQGSQQPYNQPNYGPQQPAGGACGPQQPYNQYQPYGNNTTAGNKPDNWMWLGICTTILCCLPLGVVSIVYASKVNSAWMQGNYQGAKEYADKAKLFGIISAAIGFVFGIIGFIAGLAG